jgi:hypothetical protein
MRLKAALQISVTALLLCVPMTSARAQHNQYSNDLGRFDIALGLTFNTPRNVNLQPQCDELQIACKDENWFFDFGIGVQGAMHFGEHMALMLEATSYNNRWTKTDFGDPQVNHVSAVLIGARYAQTLWRDLSDTPRITAFAHALVGPEYSTEVVTRIAVEPGIGIDSRITPLATLRLSLDHRFTRGGPRNLSANQLLVGVVLGRM